MFLKPIPVSGQGSSLATDVQECVEGVGRVHAAWTLITRAYRDSEPLTPDSLAFVARRARQARECFGEAEPARRTWLLYRETWSLDQLRRYREAADLVDLFYEELAGGASDLYLARFALFKVRYRSFAGDIDSAVAALEEARGVIGALPYSDQLHADLTGASLRADAGRYRSAIDVAEEVHSMAARAAEEGETGMDFVQARSRFIEAEARMEIALRDEGTEDQWRSIAESLEWVALSYRDLEKRNRRGAALANLGEVYFEMGDLVRSDARLREAFREASDDPKSMIYALLRRGRVRARGRQYRLAEADFRRGLALADSSGIHKYTFDLLFEEARLDEERRRLSRARQKYQAITARLVPFAEGAIRAASLQGEAAVRTRDVEHLLLLRERAILWIAVVLSLLLAAFAVAAAIASRWRRSSEADTATRLVGRTAFFYMEEIVTHTKATAGMIRKTDRHLARRLSRGKLRGKMELYQCLALLINSVEADDLNGHSARMRLYRLFKSRNWDWPEGDDPIEAWRAHFEHHPLG